MRVDKITPQNRRKRVAGSVYATNEATWFKWNGVEGRYDFVVEFSSLVTGERYQIIGSQIEWMRLQSELENRFSEAPG